MGEVIKFPKQVTPIKVKLKMHANRLDELEVENKYIRDDITYLKKALKTNIDEIASVVKQMTLLNGEAGVHQAEFENEWGDDFEFTPDFNIDDNPEED